MTSPGGTAATADHVAPRFEPLESKLHPPELLAGNVPRTALVDLLRDSRSVPVVLVAAAPGYGKTTLLAQWASRSRRRFAWVSVDQRDNDPILLLSYIAAALDRLSFLEPGTFEVLRSANASIEGAVVPRIGRALASMETPFVLALDDLHALTNPQCLDAIDALIDYVPSGSTMVLSGRAQPSRRVGALRARGLALEIGPDELRMEEGDARELLNAAEMAVSDTELSELVQRTEGWPAGLYLAALAAKAGGEKMTGGAFRGDDPYLADYLRAELLARLPEHELRFLTRTSVLERLSGPLCDAVLEAGGSAERLASLERSNHFVVALDRGQEWYRYHHLFRDLVRVELGRSEPDLAPALLARASDWSDANGEPQGAVSYAQAAGDVDRVARLVLAHIQPEYEQGRAVTVERWFEWLEDRGAMDRHPGVAALGAWLAAIRGRPDQSERWADAAKSGVGESTEQNDGGSAEPWLAVLEAAQCRHGVERMAADAQRAATAFGRASPFWPTAAVLLALARQFSGEYDRADDLLAQVAEMAVALEISNAGSLAFALRALIAIEREDWVAAEELTEKAESIVRRSRMEDYPLNALVSAAAAQIAIHRREQPRADQYLTRAQRLRPQLTRALAPFSIFVRIVLARAYAARADVAGARTVLREADDLLRRGTDFGNLTEEAGKLRSQLETLRVEAPGASTLTAAELRLLPFLATHLSFREIGERLFLSVHTVRSQGGSIYRKLEVTSRNTAVERARDLGLL
jgi:LuxR family transcriptional regulator, maltose regulon positive regulatory protein